MEIPCTEKEAAILSTVSDAAAECRVSAFVIGGFVRDKILGRETKDIDIVCDADGIKLAEKVASMLTPKPYISVFKNFGTAQLVMQDIEIEFVGARKESYSVESRKPFVSAGSIKDDQDRRDFTINALAINLTKESYGTLSDPFNGVQDLKDKIIRTPLEPDITFSDDPLRMMRAIRFAAQLNFNIHPLTYEAIKRNVQRISIISGERIAEELNKILLSKKPSIGFDLLYKSGLLHIIFPQMTALAGAEYIDGKGHKDNFYHTMQVIDNLAANSDDLWLRWAAVLHDIAKPATKRFEEGHGWTFHGHEVIGGKNGSKDIQPVKAATK